VIRYGVAFAFLPAFALAQTLGEDGLVRLAAAQIVVLGESHDNPYHHQVQADIVKQILPKAVVYEMLTPEQAALVRPDIVDDEDALEQALGWNGSGWPDFAIYYPIFAAFPMTTVYGAAIPRDVARQAMQDGLVAAFGADADAYGLDVPLTADQQVAREALQMSAHCDALPAELLPAMVDVQRLRDARLAQTALEALKETGGPIVVITGNGHARADWGVPAYIKLVQTDVTVVSVGQGEDDAAPEGRFDIVVQTPSVPREDPCLEFSKE
jgi:uncharacterized iron-regulated protein